MQPQRKMCGKDYEPDVLTVGLVVSYTSRPPTAEQLCSMQTATGT